MREFSSHDRPGDCPRVTFTDCTIVDILGDAPVVGSRPPSESAVSGRQQVTLFGGNVLLVGQTFHTASSLTDRLYLWKFQFYFANYMRAASELLSSQPVALLLSNTHLSDGTGVGLLPALARLPVTAFLCLPVENRSFWLPAIDGGKFCLGLPALRPSEFGRILEQLARCLPVAPRAKNPAPKARVA
jgi:hypothetical protein